MPKYLIEREVPSAGALTTEQLKGISQTSCGVLNKMGPSIQWVHSYVAGDKIREGYSTGAVFYWAIRK